MAVTRGKDHVFEIANEAYCQLTGRRDLVGKTAAAGIPALGAQGFIEMLAEIDRCLESGETIERELDRAAI